MLDAINRIRRGRPRDTKGTSRPSNAPVAVYPGSGGALVHTVPNTRVDWVCYLFLLRSDPGGGGRQLTYLLLTTITGIPPSHRPRLTSSYTSHPSVHTRPLSLAPTLRPSRLPHDLPLSASRQATAPQLDGDASRPTGIASYFLLLTSYFLLITLHLDIKAKRARAGEGGRGEPCAYAGG